VAKNICNRKLIESELLSNKDKISLPKRRSLISEQFTQYEFINQISLLIGVQIILEYIY
jgi:hypothetical protein